MSSIRTIVIMVAAVAGFTLATAVPAFAQGAGDCLSTRQIQNAIESGEIQSWPRIKRLARIANDYQEVSDLSVCRIGGRLYYIVNLSSPDGGYEKFAFNAVNGARERL